MCLSCPVCFIKCFIKVSNKSLIRFLVAQTVNGHLSSHLFWWKLQERAEGNFIKLQKQRFSPFCYPKPFSSIYSRTQIHFTVAIDFTASNGECFSQPSPQFCFHTYDLWLRFVLWMNGRGRVFPPLNQKRKLRKRKFSYLMTWSFSSRSNMHESFSY